MPTPKQGSIRDKPLSNMLREIRMGNNKSNNQGDVVVSVFASMGFH